MRISGRSIPLLLSVVLLAAASSAEAQTASKERLAIARLDWIGNVPPPLQRALADRLASGLSAVAFEVLRPTPEVVAGRGQACTTAECWQKLAESLRVSYLVSASVDEREKTFAITLELISGR